MQVWVQVWVFVLPDLSVFSLSVYSLAKVKNPLHIFRPWGKQDCCIQVTQAAFGDFICCCCVCCFRSQIYCDHSFPALKLFLLRSSDVILLPEASRRERLSPRRNSDVITSLQVDRHFLCSASGNLCRFCHLCWLTLGWRHGGRKCNDFHVSEAPGGSGSSFINSVIPDEIGPVSFLLCAAQSDSGFRRFSFPQPTFWLLNNLKTFFKCS